VKEATKKDAKSKKRSLNVDKLEKPKKRPRTHASHSRFATNSNNLIDPSDTVAVRLSDHTLSTTDSVQPSNRMRNTERRPISLPVRSGRNTRLLARFL
jgi:hypothetical protein